MYGEGNVWKIEIASNWEILSKQINVTSEFCLNFI
jgi:hypothetical protein